jgi:hypothetical protein
MLYDRKGSPKNTKWRPIDPNNNIMNIIMSKTRLLRLSFSILISFGIGLAATAQTPPPPSSPAEKDGLTVVLQPLKDTFQLGEPLAIKLTFQNTSKEAFRLPDRVNPAKLNYWQLQLTNVDTGKSYTGVTTLPMGAAPEPGEITPVPVDPGKTLTTTATLKSYGYVEGALDFAAAKHELFQQAVAARGANRGSVGRGPAAPQLPAGTYKASVNVRFASFPTSPNVPDRIRAAQAQIAASPIPLWKGTTILSNPVEIKIVAPPEASPAPMSPSVQP